ncbi:hypothetical protein [Actinomadura sp. 3N407]
MNAASDRAAGPLPETRRIRDELDLLVTDLLVTDLLTTPDQRGT